MRLSDDAEPRKSWRLANQYAIPGTGIRWNGHYFRKPRNLGAKRALLAALGTLRGVDVPPSDWADLHIQANRSRNWKRHRQTQWRETR